jgi:hypothetical protein
MDHIWAARSYCFCNNHDRKIMLSLLVSLLLVSGAAQEELVRVVPVNDCAGTYDPKDTMRRMTSISRAVAACTKDRFTWTIEVPKESTTLFRNACTTACGNAFVLATARAGHQAIGVDPLRTRALVFLVTRAPACAWLGQAYLPGRVMWVNGVAALNKRVVLHEWGHNKGLGHARAGSDPYGDTSCVMGSGKKCFNAPHEAALLGEPPPLIRDGPCAVVLNRTNAFRWNQTTYVSYRKGRLWVHQVDTGTDLVLEKRPRKGATYAFPGFSMRCVARSKDVLVLKKTVSR